MATLPPTPETFKVEDAWKPLPRSVWNEETAAHLLRRLTFAATPHAVNEALKGSPADAIEKAFRDRKPLEMSADLAEFKETIQSRYKEINRGNYSEDERREMRNELRKEENKIFREYAMTWFQHAWEPENSATEKLVLFLQDIFVVDRQTIKDAPKLFMLQKTLRDGIELNYPDLCKWVSREPAMIDYLDLDKSTRIKPNENFARELFELFILGEGNYTETDIKEAARALTGYRVRNRYDFYFQKSLHDETQKTVFGETSFWDGDDVIDISFRQPAARTFLIREMTKFYLSDTPVPEPYIEALGEQWANREFNLRYLVETFFQSRLFYHPGYRGNLVKSPIHFYLGLCHDLKLNIVPFQSRLLRSMDVMGQSFYNPPNVRGWLYGEHWINSTTISARRQLVDYLFIGKLNEEKLNGNDQRDLEAARKAGRGDFLVTWERLKQLNQMDPEQISKHLTTFFITAPSRPAYQPILEEIISAADKPAKGIRHAVIALLQSPAYNLC